MRREGQQVFLVRVSIPLKDQLAYDRGIPWRASLHSACTWLDQGSAPATGYLFTSILDAVAG